MEVAVNPTHVSLDLGRTKLMVSRHAVSRFLQAALACGLECEIVHSSSRVLFAKSTPTPVHQALRSWFSDEASCIYYCGYCGAGRCTDFAAPSANEESLHEA